MNEIGIHPIGHTLKLPLEDLEVGVEALLIETFKGRRRVFRGLHLGEDELHRRRVELDHVLDDGSKRHEAMPLPLAPRDKLNEMDLMSSRGFAKDRQEGLIFLSAREGLGAEIE